ncbi:hypothetical protein [Paenibacillus sp. Leaf72]|uniref:hypothetical protein n=1 Tax=Paenibacillus sp. Leaf72 TaxID=1736234 RepID=UPI0006F6FCCE|nr:hypothetical protein [Paenibacillus sp. Leaf72]KQN96991.1 hypothetical protein ASF12_23265 [Paenibacillus sp. Leaf72]
MDSNLEALIYTLLICVFIISALIIIVFVAEKILEKIEYYRSLRISENKVVHPIASPFEPKSKAPIGVDWLRSDENFIKMEQKLNEALSATDFESKLRFKVKESHPEINDNDFNWLLHELKRFFILCEIMKNTGMYSSQVDIVWHQAILFTKEYQQFCTMYAGRVIHHEPRIGSILKHNDVNADRVLFEQCYRALFKIKPENLELLGKFTYSPDMLSKSFIHDLQNLSKIEIMNDYFRVNPSPQAVKIIFFVISFLISSTQVKRQLPHQADVTGNKAVIRHSAERQTSTATNRDNQTLNGTQYVWVDSNSGGRSSEHSSTLQSKDVSCSDSSISSSSPSCSSSSASTSSSPSSSSCSSSSGSSCGSSCSSY